MKLSEKIRYLRQVEGTLRGLGRELTQQEVVRAVKQELKQTISQSYLSQIESGARPHLTGRTRALLARFFKVHPGYLVDDPEGYHTELTSELRQAEESLDVWLMKGAEQFRKDAEVSQALQRAARRDDTRRCVLLLGAIAKEPGLVEKLEEVLLGRERRQAPERRKSPRGGDR